MGEETRQLQIVFSFTEEETGVGLAYRDALYVPLDADELYIEDQKDKRLKGFIATITQMREEQARINEAEKLLAERKETELFTWMSEHEQSSEGFEEYWTNKIENEG